MYLAQTSIHEELMFTLEKTIRNVKESFNREFYKQNFGITFDKWLVLEQIFKKQGINQRVIAKSVVKEPATVCRMIKALEKEGVILKINDVKNKRSSKLYLTHKGYDLSVRIAKMYQECYAKHFDGIYDREMNLVNEILNRVNSRVNTRHLDGSKPIKKAAAEAAAAAAAAKEAANAAPVPTADPSTMGASTSIPPTSM